MSKVFGLGRNLNPTPAPIAVCKPKIEELTGFRIKYKPTNLYIGKRDRDTHRKDTKRGDIYWNLAGANLAIRACRSHILLSKNPDDYEIIKVKIVEVEENVIH